MAGRQQPISPGFEQMLREDAERAGIEPPAPAGIFEVPPPVVPLQRFEIPEVDWRAEQEERERAERAAREKHATDDPEPANSLQERPAPKQTKTKSSTPNLDKAREILGRDAK